MYIPFAFDGGRREGLAMYCGPWVGLKIPVRLQNISSEISNETSLTKRANITSSEESSRHRIFQRAMILVRRMEPSSSGSSNEMFGGIRWTKTMKEMKKAPSWLVENVLHPEIVRNVRK